MIDRREFAGLTAAATLCALSPVRAADRPLQPRQSEVAALRVFAETTHPRGRDAKLDGDWQRRWARLEQAVDSLSDGAYFVEARRALGWFDDGHTTLLPFQFTGGVPSALASGPFGLVLPYRVRVFDDGAYVAATSADLAPLAGQRIETVGALSAAALIQTMTVDWPGNMAWAQRWSGQAFTEPALLQAFGATIDPAAALALGLSGSPAPHRIVPQRGTPPALTDMARTPSRVERAAKDNGLGNFVLPMLEAKAIYVSIDEMADVEGKSFEALTRDCVAAMAVADQHRLIIDLRRNGGGNNFVGEPIRRIIAASRFNRTGNLYVLIGPRTFSAAQNLANRLERETMAVFVGTPSGGQPNHYGDAASFTGDTTGITAIVSTKSWFDSYPSDLRPWIMPDLLVPERFADWQAGHDPAFDLALTHRPERLVEELDPDRVFYFGRKSQSASWQPFWATASDRSGEGQAPAT